MAKINRLAAVAVARAKPREAEYLLADGGGLFLRVRPDGSRSWMLRYDFGGSRRKIGLGSADAVSLSAARAQAAELREQLAAGRDPQLARAAAVAEQVAARQALADRLTLAGLFERWFLAEIQPRHRDGGAYVRGQFERHILPALGAMPIESVTKGHVRQLADAQLKLGQNRTARVLFSLTRQLFKYAIESDLIDTDPTSAISKAKLGPKPTERERTLSEDEVRLLAKQLPQSGMAEINQLAVWIALGTCCRIGELLAAEWSHVDFESRVWTIPAENSKNGRAHHVGMSDFVLGLFRKLRDSTGGQPWIYPNRTKSGPIDPKTITKQLGDRQRGEQEPMRGRASARTARALELPGGRWTAHDLRRTGATLMVALGVAGDVADRCLNHADENKVRRIYLRHDFSSEMSEAWQLLGQRLELLTRDDADNVVLLPKRA